MASSMLWRKSLTTTTHCLAPLATVRVSPPAVKKTTISMLWRKSLTTTTNCLASLASLRVSSPAVQKTTIIPLGQSIATVPSPTAFRRMCSIHQPEPQPEEHKKKPKMEKENEEQSKEEPETEDMQFETMVTELYNTSQKILIACVEDFTFPHAIASKLGDGSNITVISQNSCGEMKRLHENARSHMLDLSRLGATVVFNVDFTDFSNDSRINHTLYDRIILDMP